MSRRIAIFDLDGTLLHGDTDELWLKFLIDEGHVDGGQMRARNDDIQRRYAEGMASAEEFCFFYLDLLKGHTATELQPLYAKFFDNVVTPKLPRRAFDLVAMEKSRADVLVMSTATNAFLSAPIGRHLGFEHIIATDPGIDRKQRFTGGCSGLPNMRAHKVPRLDAFLAVRGEALSSFDESWFYSDSRNDLPLLRAVTHPVAVDPDRELEAHAEREGWPVLRMHTDGAA